MASYKYKKEYDMVIHVGDRVCNKKTGRVYKVTGVQWASEWTLVVGCVGQDLEGLQDVLLEGDRGEKYTAAAVYDKVMSEYWEKVG